MISKKWVLLSLSTIPLLLAGCDSENLESIQESSTEIDRVKDETVDSFNQLVALETDLQSHFDATLETDEDLATFADETSPVFENISSREELISELEDKHGEFEDYQETLTDYDGELLNHSEVSAVNDAADSFKSHLSTYLENYQESLNNQREYFIGISSDDATYESFVEGIDTLNEERQTLSQTVLEMDDALVNLDSQLETLQSSIEEQLSEEE